MDRSGSSTASFRGRARLFFTDERWKDESKKHYARLSLPGKAATFLKPLLAKGSYRVSMLWLRRRSGVLRVDDELHLSVYPPKAKTRSHQATGGFGSPHRRSAIA